MRQSGFRNGSCAVRRVERVRKLCVCRAGASHGSVQASSAPEVRDKFVARLLNNCVQETSSNG